MQHVSLPTEVACQLHTRCAVHNAGTTYGSCKTVHAILHVMLTMLTICLSDSLLFNLRQLRDIMDISKHFLSQALKKTQAKRKHP